jgi:3-oxoacyl-[acyl-carrier protein] reductase
MELKDRVAIVTGGATGIGRAVCTRLATAGAAAIVVNYAHSADDAESTAVELRSLGAEALAIKADIADESAVRAMVATTIADFGRLDVLINNAGTTQFVPYADLDGLTEDIWNEVLGVNLKGTFYCCRAAASELKKTRGVIVNVASIAGHRATGSSIAYGVSKAGVVQLTRALAAALAPEVRVNSVSPSLVSSRWFRKRFGEEAADAQEAAFVEGIPLGAIASPDDVAHAIVSLVENDMITGQDLIVDGGRTFKY